MPKKIVITKLGGPEVLKYVEYELPNIIPDNEVRIKQTSIGLNYIDTYHRSGIYPLPKELPFCPGLEGSGEIIDVGKNVNEFSIGDRVCYASIPIGAYCEIRENVKIGDNTSFGSRCTISANALIGSDVTIKYGFVLTDTPNLKEDKIKIVKGISDGTLIGANVTLMPGFSIGKNCIIGACSQVRNNIKDNEIWYGNPAKFFKKTKNSIF